MMAFGLGRTQFSMLYLTPSPYCRHSCIQERIITPRSELQNVLFLALSVCVFLFVYEIYREVLTGFVPYSHGRRVWSLTRMSLKVKVTGDENSIFGPFGGLSAVFVVKRL